MQREIQFGSKVIVFSLSRHNRGSLGIKVYPGGSIEVFAPVDADEGEIFRKLRSKAPWVLKQLDHFDSFRPLTPPRKYVSGETHLYLGRQYRLKIVAGADKVIKAYSGQLWMYNTDITPTALNLQLYQWYREKAITVFEEMLDEVLPKFRKYKIEKPALIVRSMSKRWGSCTPAGKIILNTELIKAPKGSIEYVIIHELCHLVHHNHTKPFFDLQNRMLPDWKKWKDRLEYSLA